jgi:hypothetical protein
MSKKGPKEQQMSFLEENSVKLKIEDTKYYDYPDNSPDEPINIYAIRDSEVRRTFHYFMESVSDIFSQSERSGLEQAEDFASYFYATGLLAELTLSKIPLDDVKKNTRILPLQFTYLFTDPEDTPDIAKVRMVDLKNAEREMLEIVADYMAHKYKKPFSISFDGIYFGEKYVPEGGLFNQKDYNEHMERLYENGVEHQSIVVSAAPTTLVPAVLIRDWGNDETTALQVNWDLDTGVMVIEEESLREEENLHDDGLKMLHAEKLVYEDMVLDVERIEGNPEEPGLQQGGEMILVANPALVVDAINGKKEAKKELGQNRRPTGPSM